MSDEMGILAISAASLGFIHTLLGPDHYLPFIVMARAGKWSWSRTSWITVLCGIGHIGSSVLLGFAGIALGTALTSLTALESWRGNLAAWALIAFGLVYSVWGIRQAIRNRPHRHGHFHSQGEQHDHQHVHQGEHSHLHQPEPGQKTGPWIIFLIFVFGPCEPLIPLLMYPAAKSSLGGLILVTAIFGAVTILTMLSLVLASLRGLEHLPLARLERYGHALAGATILFCGLAIQFLGL